MDFCMEWVNDCYFVADDPVREVHDIYLSKELADQLYVSSDL